MKIKSGHYLLIALFVIFNGCGMFENIFKPTSTIVLQNNSVKEIADIEVLLGREVKKVDTNPLAPFQSQEYEVTSKSVYTVAVTFDDGTTCFRWADVSDEERVLIEVGDNSLDSSGIALSMNL